MENMLTDMGRLSLWLGAALVLLSLGGIWFVYRLVKSNTIPDGGLDKLVELGKWFMVSVAVVVSTAIVNDGFRERDQDVKEMQAFDKYTAVVLEAEGVEKRRLLSEYFASVSPEGPIKRSWQAYKRVVDAQVGELRDTQTKIAEIASNHTSPADVAERVRLLEKASALNQSLVNSPAASIKPRVYFHIRTEAQRALAAQLAKDLVARADVVVPGIQKIDEGPQMTELRYFRRAEEIEAKQIGAAIVASGTPVEAKYVQGYEDSAAIRQRHYELWIAAAK